MASENKSKVSILTNGIIKRKPRSASGSGHLLLPGCYHGSFQRAGHGRSLHLRAGVLQHPDLAAAQRDPPLKSICPATSSSLQAS